jgi:nucleoid-associated protein YgaU
MADIKCPVCGKVGIPDYHSEDVKCPCCGSDLSIYRVIDSIPEEVQKTNIWKPISAVAIIAAAVLGILLLTQKPDVPATPLAEITQLKDSIEVLNNQLAQTNTATSQISSGFKYVVSKGDSYWSISRKFYGDGSHHTEIAQANDRTLDSPLMVGDTLIIK